MRMTKLVFFRVNQEQFDRLKANASNKGFKTVSAYLRDATTKNSFLLESRLSSIDRKLAILDELILDFQNKGILKRYTSTRSHQNSWLKELKETGLIDEV